MADVTAKRIPDMEGAFGGAFKKARAELGVMSFGMAVIDMPAGAGDRYPEHDHTGDGQEEVYLALRGWGTLVVEGEEFVLDDETIVRVGPTARRKLFAGPDGVRMLVLGGVPAGVYEPPAFSELRSPP